MGAESGGTGRRAAVPSFVETGKYASGMNQLFWSHLYTPIGPAQQPPSVATDPVQHLFEALDFGCLTAMYDRMLPNVTEWQHKQSVMRHIFPIAPIRLGPGFVEGRERLETKVSGTFSMDGSTSSTNVHVHKFDRGGWLLSAEKHVCGRAEHRRPPGNSGGVCGCKYR
jgi:hypothetical protein